MALANDFSITGAARWRDSFQDNRSYGTVEGSLAAAYTLNENNILGVRIAMERGALDRNGSDFNTLGAFYTLKF